jgi:hypothetical protein
MDFKLARKILKTYDRKLIEDYRDCLGSAVIFNRKKKKWEMRIYLTQINDSNKHLSDMRFGKTMHEAKKEESENKDELNAVLVEGIIKAIDLNYRTSKHRPAMGGISVMHYLPFSAGSIGGTAYRKEDGRWRRKGISCSHVLALSNKANIGDPILQPGSYDGGSYPDDVIGKLEDYVEIQFENWDGPYNYVDCAIFKPTTESLLSDTITEMHGLTSVVKHIGGNDCDYVRKVGRTTGLRKNYIVGITGLVAVYYGTPGLAIYDEQIVVEWESGIDDAFVEPGDSGSLVMNNCSKKIVGLVFAACPECTEEEPFNCCEPPFALLNPADKIEELLNIKFAPIRRIPTSVTGKILGKVVDGIRKICKLCCCPPEPCFPSIEGCQWCAGIPWDLYNGWYLVESCDCVVGYPEPYEGNSYICIQNHIATADKRPESGQYWALYWRKIKSPKYVQVTISGHVTAGCVQDGHYYCSGNINGTYILPESSPGSCYWTATFPWQGLCGECVYPYDPNCDNCNKVPNLDILVIIVSRDCNPPGISLEVTAVDSSYLPWYINLFQGGSHDITECCTAGPIENEITSVCWGCWTGGVAGISDAGGEAPPEGGL